MRKFPNWIRILSLIVGLLLLSDGMRRFIAPGEARDLHAFLFYIAMGVACLVVGFFPNKKK